MIIELTHKEPFPFSNHYENLSKQRYFKKYFVKLLGIPEVQLMRLGADVEADRAYLFNKFHKIESTTRSRLGSRLRDTELPESKNELRFGLARGARDVKSRLKSDFQRMGPTR